MVINGLSGGLSGTLGGRYRLEEEVASGGMGTVVRGHDDVLHRTVAIKLMKPELAEDPATVERFQREARIAASLSHPGIAQVFDFGQDDGRPFIVMEYLDGEDLRSLLLRRGRIPVSEALEIVARAADALDHAHRAGAVHRDIKPGNIFLTRSNDVKVTDFGIARIANAATLTAIGTVLGTFLYAPPEQALGEPVTPAGDIYSLGCVLFELLAGKPPFEGDSLAAISMAHVSRPAPTVSQNAPNIPAEVDAVISKCLAKDPRGRWTSAGDLAVAIRAAAEPGRPAAGDATLPFVRSEESTAAREVRPRRRSGSPGGRGARIRPVAAVLVLATAILTAILVAGTLGPNRDSGPKVVPSWVGQHIDQARSDAARLGILIAAAPTESSNEPTGQVLRQDPPPGTDLEQGGGVTLFVSSGPEMATVPNVIDLDLDEATKTLEQYGFKSGIVAEVPGKRDKVVVAQDPSPGTLRAKGTTVGLTISRRDRGKDGGDD